MTTQLSHTISWAHRLLAEVLRPGDLALDLTAGNGHDTLFLQRQVGAAGTVLTFDIQEDALEATAGRLRDAGVACRRVAAACPVAAPGVHLVRADHAECAAYLGAAPQGVIANLGFLPGGDQTLITRPESTVRALQGVCERLAPGGRIAVVVYVGHPGGAEEGRALEAFCAALPGGEWQTLKMATLNRAAAPWLALLEKR